MPRILLILFALGVAIYCLIDIGRAPGHKVRTLPKGVWLLAIVLVPYLGPISYLIYGRPKPELPAPPPRAIAPDDDPEYLAELARRNKLQQWEDDLLKRERDLRQDGDPDPGGPDTPRG